MKTTKSKRPARCPLPTCSPIFLSDDECKEIIVSACNVRPHTEDELTALIRWAEIARMNNTLVDMILDGKMRVEWTPENEPQFNSVNS